MAGAEKRSIPTRVGDVEFETVECAACEQELLKENARRFIIGDLKRAQTGYGDPSFKFHPHSYVAGWACAHCRDDPVAFPAGRTWFNDPADAIFMAFVAALGLLVIGVTIGVAL